MLCLHRYPRMLVTVDADMQPVPISVRVGMAVDTVGQAGKPKTITGFQTHTTPVLLAHGERAELADQENGEYLAVTRYATAPHRTPAACLHVADCVSDSRGVLASCLAQPA